MRVPFRSAPVKGLSRHNGAPPPLFHGPLDRLAFLRAGIVPITCGTTFKVEDKSRIFVNGVEEMAAAAKRPHDVVLLEAEGGITLANGVLDAANAHIAAQTDKSAGSMLRLSGGGKQLVLHVSYPNGTTIMIK